MSHPTGNLWNKGCRTGAENSGHKGPQADPSIGRAIFFGNFSPFFFLGIFSRFLVEGRCEEGRKEGMGEGSKKTNRDQKKTNKDQKKQIGIKKKN